ncbi:unnamed protein product, partial [Sphacelaria rigidula]
MFFLLLAQAKESACKTLYQYTEDLGDAFAKHAASTLALVLPNLGPRNAVSVQVVSAAIVPRLVAMASRAAASASPDSSAAAIGEAQARRVSWACFLVAQAMLDASVDALCEVVSRISSDLGAALEAGSGEDMEPTCLAADSLSSLMGDHCKVKDPSPLRLSGEREMTAVTVLRDAAAASMRRSDLRTSAMGASAAAKSQHHPLKGLTGAVDAADEEEQEEWEADLLTSAVDGIGWVIKGRREAFVPAFESTLKPLVLPLLAIDPQLQQQQQQQIVPSPSQASFALCMCIDVLEHCGESGRQSVFPSLLPALLSGCNPDQVS